MAWHGMAWHGMAWHGMAWHGMAWQCLYLRSGVFFMHNFFRFFKFLHFCFIFIANSPKTSISIIVTVTALHLPDHGFN
jgi:hypothetical protein